MRRLVLPIVVTALLLAGGAGAWAQDSPMFGTRPDHHPPPAGALAGYGGLRWRVPTAGPIRSTPAIAGDTVFVGSGDGGLYALALATGAQLWRADLGAPVHGSPAVHGGAVFVTDAHGTLHAVQRATGLPVWRIQTGPPMPFPWGHESGDLIFASPVVANDVVYWGAADGVLRATSAESGEELWQATLGGRIRSTPAVAGGRVFAGGADGVVYAVDAARGVVLWRYATEGAQLVSAEWGFDRRTIQSPPVVVDGAVFIGARDGFLYALDAQSGALRWRVDHEISWINGMPAVADGVLYTGTSDGRFFQAVDIATGEERWRTPTALGIWTAPLVAGEEVAYVDNGGTLAVLARSSGQERLNVRLPTRILASPVLSSGTLLVGGLDGAVYAVRLDAAQPLRRAVFHDTAYARAARYAGGSQLAEFLAGRGYERLDAAGLEGWLRAPDRAGRVVVFAMDHVPGDPAALRSYLEAGGTAVWLGIPPLVFPIPMPDGTLEMTDISRDATRDLLGVAHDAANFDLLGVRATPAGAALGLPDHWLAAWSASPADDLEILGLDELGGASSWRRGYGGPPGTGFVRIWGAPFAIPDPGIVQLAAELRPAR